MAKSSTTKSWWQESFEALVIAVILVSILRAFVIQAFRIPSESMCDTLLVGDFLFVNKFEYGPKIPFTHLRLPGIRAPRRGDVIVFQYPPNPSVDFIKRCIATGGQTVEVRHKDVYVDGQKLVEPYVKHITSVEDPAGYTNRDNYKPPTVPPGMLFMMGDNRDNSYDSRFWGPVAMDLVKGHAMFIYFSTAGDHWWNSLFNIRFNRFFRPIR
ncbi:MAG TPA: signal peptidase I [Candidatus Acidoferrales bacterium]|nr:signal peptidase I [Candidatus Acidoferrales bacterium]